jgi:hypothetical protein
MALANFLFFLEIRVGCSRIQPRGDVPVTIPHLPVRHRKTPFEWL